MPQTRNQKRPVEYDEIRYKDIQFRKKIGEGVFGQIFSGYLWGQEVACKVLKTDSILGSNVTVEEAMKDFKQEAEVMRQLRHPNVVEFLGVCLQKPKLCMITEYLPNGNLKDWINEKLGGELSLPMFLDICIDISRGLNWMHNKGFVHRDLKPLNILVDKNATAKVSDFGLTHVIERERSTRSKFSNFLSQTGYWGDAGTKWYMAPEVLEDGRYGVSCDVYSMAVVMAELLQGYHPFKDISVPKGSEKFAKAIVEGLRPELTEDCHPRLEALIKSMWQKKPNLRPNMSQVLKKLVNIRTDYRKGNLEGVDAPAKKVEGEEEKSSEESEEESGGQTEDSEESDEEGSEESEADSESDEDDSGRQGRNGKGKLAKTKELLELRDALEEAQLKLEEQQEDKEELTAQLDALRRRERIEKNGMQRTIDHQTEELEMLRELMFAMENGEDVAQLAFNTKTKRKRGALNSLTCGHNTTKGEENKRKRYKTTGKNKLLDRESEQDSDGERQVEHSPRMRRKGTKTKGAKENKKNKHRPVPTGRKPIRT